MNTKNMLGMCVLICFLSLPLALLVGVTTRPQSATPYVYGPETAEVGELCRFLAEGEIVKWECLPKTTDSESYGDRNDNYVVSFRKPGTYTVIAAIYAEGKVEIHTQAVVIGGATPVDDTPLPTTNVNPELVSRVEGWATKHKVDAAACKALASNFAKVSTMVENRQLATPSEVISKTAELNNDIVLNEGLMAELQAYLTSQSDAGSLNTLEQHLVVWNSIAKGLTNAANL